MVLQKVAVQVSMHLLIKVCNAPILMYNKIISGQFLENIILYFPQW